VDPEIAAALAGSGGPALVVGGTADELWDQAAANRSRGEVITVEDGDHALHLAGDVLGSIEALRRVTAAMDAFVSALSPRET
jgi:pimeloyl-ACP methyl ester carboxylesterase